jgi:hypothetical protein
MFLKDHKITLSVIRDIEIPAKILIFSKTGFEQKTIYFHKSKNLDAIPFGSSLFFRTQN